MDKHDFIWIATALAILFVILNTVLADIEKRDRQSWPSPLIECEFVGSSVVCK